MFSFFAAFVVKLVCAVEDSGMDDLYFGGAKVKVYVASSFVERQI